MQVISEDLGLKLESTDISMMGRAKKITITKDDTIILDGGGDKSAIGERCDQIREAITQSTSDYDKCAFAFPVTFCVAVLPASKLHAALRQHVPALLTERGGVSSDAMTHPHHSHQSQLATTKFHCRSVGAAQQPDQAMRSTLPAHGTGQCLSHQPPC